MTATNENTSPSKSEPVSPPPFQSALRIQTEAISAASNPKAATAIPVSIKTQRATLVPGGPQVVGQDAGCVPLRKDGLLGRRTIGALETTQRDASTPRARIGALTVRSRMSLLESLARTGLHAADNWFARISADSSAACGTLLSVLFHSLYRDTSQLGDPVLARNQNVTVEDFRCFVSALLESGYTVVSPAQVDAGLKPGGNYALITFDDGYFNNTLALGVLEQFAVPATFFVSSDHVLQNKAFWWDALSREMSKDGAADHAKLSEIKKVKVLGSDQVEQFIRERFGDDALRPSGDLDRPFTPAELRDFARHKHVHIGNHTRSHAILTRCDAHEVARQIGDCQAALTQITGKAPLAIAYPNGNYSSLAVEASLAAGLRVGLTTRPHRNLLPLEPGRSRMTLGRFIFNGGEDARHQCRKFAASFIPSNAIKRLIHRPS